ncbi:hypothetical protein Gotur_014241 [Gossypium turneri]
MFSKTFAPLEAHLEKDWPKDVTEQHWCGNQDWVPLLGLWGGVGYAPLMVQRQFVLRQFVPVTDGWAQLEFAFKGEGYMKRGSRYCEFLEKNLPNGLALYADTITIAKAKKEEERAARAMIELRKKNVEYETMSVELTASQSKRQELK